MGSPALAWHKPSHRLQLQHSTVLKSSLFFFNLFPPLISLLLPDMCCFAIPAVVYFSVTVPRCVFTFCCLLANPEQRAVDFSPTLRQRRPDLEKTKHDLCRSLKLTPLICQNPTFQDFCLHFPNASALLLCRCFCVADAHLENSSFPLRLEKSNLWLQLGCISQSPRCLLRSCLCCSLAPA